MRFKDISLQATFALSDQIETDLNGCASLEEAANQCARTIYEKFPESVALVRVFGTIPFKRLPSPEREECLRAARMHQVEGSVTQETIVLSLLGTRGVRNEWNQREESRAHRAVPLVSSAFVESIPMIASLMHDMGIGLEWLDATNPEIVVQNRGRLAGMFYVENAERSLDQKGRRIVPAREFVAENNIQTVFGVGGGYFNGMFIVIVFFTRESLTRTEVDKFLPLVYAIKAGTMTVVTNDCIFRQ